MTQKKCLVKELDTGVISEGLLDLELAGKAGYNLREATAEEMIELASTREQNAMNVESKEFLAQTDWKVLRHRDQLALGLQTSLSQSEYENLLNERQTARDSINS